MGSDSGVSTKMTKFQMVMLAMGTVLLFLTRERWAVHLLGWVAPVPFLLYLRGTRGKRAGLIFLAVFCVVSVLGAAKTFVPPWPRFMAVAFGVPLGLAQGAGYLIWAALRRRVPVWAGNLLFAAAMVTMEWLVYMCTPFGTVGVAAHSQLDNLPLLQTVSLFGVSGLGFLLYWFAAVAADAVDSRRIPRQMYWAVGLVVVFHCWGAYRIGSPQKTRTATVATVQTDFDWFATPTIAPLEERRAITKRLFERTAQAAEEGAQMVVWNEIANMVDPPDEPGILEEAKAICRKHGIHLVLSYLKMVSTDPMLWENKYVWVNPQGEVVDTYLKHKPAIPIEPAIPGKGVPKVVETGFGKAAGAICFDYDFPQIGLALAQAGADFVFVPGADSPSIDPYHSQIAAVRAIEGGYGVIRSTRHGVSAGFGPDGRARGWQSANESDEKILLVTIPTESVWTLYKFTGDMVPWLSLMTVLCLAGWSVVRRMGMDQRSHH